LLRRSKRRNGVKEKHEYHQGGARGRTMSMKSKRRSTIKKQQ